MKKKISVFWWRFCWFYTILTLASITIGYTPDNELRLMLFSDIPIAVIGTIMQYYVWKPGMTKQQTWLYRIIYFIVVAVSAISMRYIFRYGAYYPLRGFIRISAFMFVVVIIAWIINDIFKSWQIKQINAKLSENRPE